jgi:hypothetical protein
MLVAYRVQQICMPTPHLPTSVLLHCPLFVCAQVICLHNAFLSAALQRCLLTETHMVRHISVLLQAAHALAKEVAGLNDSSTGTRRFPLHIGLVLTKPRACLWLCCA